MQLLTWTLQKLRTLSDSSLTARQTSLLSPHPWHFLMKAPLSLLSGPKTGLCASVKVCSSRWLTGVSAPFGGTIVVGERMRRWTLTSHSWLNHELPEVPPSREVFLVLLWSQQIWWYLAVLNSSSFFLNMKLLYLQRPEAFDFYWLPMSCGSNLTLKQSNQDKHTNEPIKLKMIRLNHFNQWFPTIATLMKDKECDIT